MLKNVEIRSLMCCLFNFIEYSCELHGTDFFQSIFLQSCKTLQALSLIALTMHIGVIRWQSCAPVPLLYPTRAKQPVPPVWIRMKSRSEFRLGVKRMQLALGKNVC